jgi:hypothetical protein
MPILDFTDDELAALTAAARMALAEDRFPKAPPARAGQESTNQHGDTSKHYRL